MIWHLDDAEAAAAWGPATGPRVGARVTSSDTDATRTVKAAAFTVFVEPLRERSDIAFLLLDAVGEGVNTGP
jgi:hypothetical protein